MVARQSGRLCACSGDIYPALHQQPAGVARGLQVSLRNVLQNLFLKRQVNIQFLQPTVLKLQLLQLPGQPDYIAKTGAARDGLEFVGFMAMAPDDISAVVLAPTDTESAKKAIDELTQTFSDNVFEFAHFAMMLWGIQAAYPDTLEYTDIYTTDGAKVLDEIYRKNMCAISGANVGRMQLPGKQDHFSTPGLSE